MKNTVQNAVKRTLTLSLLLLTMAVPSSLYSAAAEAAKTKTQQDIINTFVLNASKGKLKKMSKHLDNQLIVNGTNADGFTALQKAAQKGQLSVVKALIKHGANVNQQTVHGKSTALLLACLNNNPTIAAYLIKHGADVNLESSIGLTPLQAAALKCNFANVRMLIAQKETAVDATNNHGYTALDLAQQHKCPKGIIKMLEKPVDKAADVR